jgi:CO/xanthine dehydrogenase Mo-binding subunit
LDCALSARRYFAGPVYNATGVRVRDLPITPAKLVGRL